MSDFRRRNVYDDSWDTIKTLTWPLEQPPNGNNITILRLLQFSIHPETLSYFLRQTPNVHTFELSVLEPVEMETNDITAFREALHPIRNTLRDLTIRYTVAEEEECPPPQDSVDVIDGSLGPLHDFPILTSLTVSLAVLFGRHGVHTGRYPQLVDFLAPRLQKLTITDDLWMYSDFQGCFEDMDAMQIFRRFLTGEMVEGGWTGGTQYEKAVWVPSGDVPGWKVATPDLKEFVYDIREHIQESHGYWSKRKYRNELRRATRGQGLECTVLHR
ncbi:hypothetical protein T440DRAFT_471651 [Plenodomus tracheiphilus IPT5]|uniref:Uncharacterized protein n=1 Tax=Plenodomus tracheiphilus IPT5 TaxID=1408161 RepID=A0A6A7AWQ7_9PLEO|nr:hypothetical protein T440DRAFT_471651 [Plenodomus tracheiphilus IPT5]